MRKLKQFNQKLEINYKQMLWEIEDKQIQRRLYKNNGKNYKKEY